MANKYERLKVLGEGSFGTAYLAVNKETGEKQVCKDIALNLLRDEDSVRCVLNEVRILSKCRHSRNVVTYLDAFVSGGFLTIVMEYADKGDMQQRINRQRGIYIQEKLILGWFVQIVFALEYIHSRNILHRDIKPSNVFMSSCGLLKLGDFGIARMLEAEGDMAETVLGTPLYLSPEICNCQPYGSQTDMWSLGVVLYQLCSLTVPFIAATRQKLFTVITTCRHKPIPGHYGSLLADLVDVLLSKDPSRRPSASQLLRVPTLQASVRALAHLRRPLSPFPKAPARRGRIHSSSSRSPSPTSSQRSSPSPPSVSPEQPRPSSPDAILAASPVQLTRLRDVKAVSPLVSRVGSPSGRLLLPNFPSPKSSGSGLPRAASPMVATPSERRSSRPKSPPVGSGSPKPSLRSASPSPSRPAMSPSYPPSPKSSCSKAPTGHPLSSLSPSPQRPSAPAPSPTPMEEEEVVPRYINAVLPPVEVRWVACSNEGLLLGSPGQGRSPSPGKSERVGSPVRKCVQDGNEGCDSRLPSVAQRRSPRVRAVRKLPSPSAGKCSRQDSNKNEGEGSPPLSRLDRVQKAQNDLADSPPLVPDYQSPGLVKRKLSRKRSRSRTESPLARPVADTSNIEARAVCDNAGKSTTSSPPETWNPVTPTENYPNVSEHPAERRHSAPPKFGALVSEKDPGSLGDVQLMCAGGKGPESMAVYPLQQECNGDQKATEYGGRTFSVPAKLRRLAKVSPFLEETIERQRRTLVGPGQDDGQGKKGRPPTLCLARALAHTKESSCSSTRDSGTHSLDFTPSPVLEPGKPLSKIQAVKTPDEMETEQQYEKVIHHSDGPDDLLDEVENGPSASQEEIPSEDLAAVKIEVEVSLLPSNSDESEVKELCSFRAVPKEHANVGAAMEVSVRADRSHDSGYGSAGSLSHETKLEVGSKFSLVHTTSVTVQAAEANLQTDADEAEPAGTKNTPPESEEELKQRYRKRIAGKQLIFDFDSKVVQLYQNESSDVSPRKWFVGPNHRLSPPPPKRTTPPVQKREADNAVTPTNGQPQSQYGNGQRTSSCVVEVGDVWDGSSTEEASGSERCPAPSCDAAASGESSSAQAPSSSRVAAARDETSGTQQPLQNAVVPTSLPAHMRRGRSSTSDVRSPLEDDVFMSDGSPKAWVKEVSCNATYTVKFHKEEENKELAAVALEPATLAVVCYNVYRSSQQDVGRAVRELREYLAKKLGTEACLLVYHLIRHTASQPALGSSLALRNTIQSYAPFFPLFTQLLQLESLAAVRGRPPM